MVALAEKSVGDFGASLGRMDHVTFDETESNKPAQRSDENTWSHPIGVPSQHNASVIMRLPTQAKEGFMRSVAADYCAFRRVEPLNNVLGHVLTTCLSAFTGAVVGFAAGGPFGALVGASMGAYFGLVSSLMRHFNAKGRANLLALKQDVNPLPTLQRRLIDLQQPTENGRPFRVVGLAAATERMEIRQSVEQYHAYLLGKRHVIKSLFSNQTAALQNMQNQLARIAIGYHIETLDEEQTVAVLNKIQQQVDAQLSEAEAILETLDTMERYAS